VDLLGFAASSAFARAAQTEMNPANNRENKAAFMILFPFDVFSDRRETNSQPKKFYAARNVGQEKKPAKRIKT
jgi:hypothetical protein